MRVVTKKMPLAVAVAAATLLAVSSCVRSGGKISPDWNVVDLSHKLDADIPMYPGGTPFQLKTLAGYQRGYYLNSFSTGEHTGTHVDAPIHFAKGAKAMDEIPLADLAGPLVLISTV